MAEKLRLISKGIPWFLLFRASLPAFVWLLTPFPLFVVVGTLVFLMPLFRPSRFAVPFILTVFLGGIFPKSLILGGYLGVLFFLILGIKDLVFVRRASAAPPLFFLLLFGSSFSYFAHFENISGPFFVWAFLLALAYFLLVRGVFRYRDAAEEVEAAAHRRASFIFGIGTFLLFGLLVVLMFLPLNYFSQTALFFLSVVMMTELLAAYLDHRLNRFMILTHASIYLVFLVLVLAMNQWEL